ncbi:MAG: hypothetical protein Q8O30_11225 [Candidatus Omnitrophota bacterium]|nr:hypothetical protein [Candidatus Omnitrophota bacterium]
MENKNKTLNIVSLILLCINILMLIIIAIAWDTIANKFSAVYREFNLELPLATQIVILWRYLFFAIIISILIAKEFLKNKLLTLILNAVTLIGIPIILKIFLTISIFLPIFKLSTLSK